MKDKRIEIQYLYLDLVTCERCVGTDDVLEDVIKQLQPVLELADYKVEYKKIEMETVQQAIEYKFLSSPTIRVNGKDICDTIVENDCKCCGEISGTSVDCRVFEYEGKQYEIPPKVMLAEAILKAIFSGDNDISDACEEYKVPSNLKRFYRGKMLKKNTDSGK